MLPMSNKFDSSDWTVAEGILGNELRLYYEVNMQEDGSVWTEEFVETFLHEHIDYVVGNLQPKHVGTCLTIVRGIADLPVEETESVLAGSTYAATILRNFAAADASNGVFDFNSVIYVRFKDISSGAVVLCEPGNKMFKRYLVAGYYAHYKETMSERTYRSCVLNITSLPVSKVTLYRRVAEIDGVFYFDLSDGTGRVVRITEVGWSVVVPDTPIFIWVDHALPAYFPNEVDEPVVVFNRLWEFLNTDKKYLLLHKIVFLFSFMCRSPQPITILHGEHGSGKSYLAKVWKQFADPSTAGPRSLSKDMNALAHVLGTNWVVPYDNVSGIKQAQSDMLCQASTGGAVQSRKLYTDGDSFNKDLLSVVILNGINITATQPDLLRRCILFFIPYISASQRMTEEHINANIAAMGSDILGAIFSLVVKSMGLVDEFRDMPNKPTMADFAVWGCAIAKALGEEPDRFLSLYATNRTLQSEEVIHNDQTNAIIKETLDNAEFKDGLFMIPKDSFLQDIIRETEAVSPLLVRDKYFPKTVPALTRKLGRLRATLRELGYTYTEERRRFGGNQTRVYVFKCANVPLLDSVPRVTPSPFTSTSNKGRGISPDKGSNTGTSAQPDSLVKKGEDIL